MYEQFRPGRFDQRKLAAEVALIEESTRNNRVSLNEHVRKSELAKEARLRNKTARDQKTVLACNHNKYYELTLADVSKYDLRPVSTDHESDSSNQSEELESGRLRSTLLLSAVVTLVWPKLNLQKESGCCQNPRFQVAGI